MLQPQHSQRTPIAAAVVNSGGIPSQLQYRIGPFLKQFSNNFVAKGIVGGRAGVGGSSLRRGFFLLQYCFNRTGWFVFGFLNNSFDRSSSSFGFWKNGSDGSGFRFRLNRVLFLRHPAKVVRRGLVQNRVGLVQETLRRPFLQLPEHLLCPLLHSNQKDYMHKLSFQINILTNHISVA